ncbi:Regulator of nonsense transcripts 3B [Chelonia mydas]|uniref:Regulator of nonsense transcripts 3B n=1 Tax=Chelonia mydas TaxID=8469 RepID=M7BTI7_CHEMY|nr:Regulator of nonsense transcripts 3B [Chelonia mydas]
MGPCGGRAPGVTTYKRGGCLAAFRFPGPSLGYRGLSPPWRSRGVVSVVSRAWVAAGPTRHHLGTVWPKSPARSSTCGQEYAAIVEFAPFQKSAKKKNKKKDAKTGTIDDDPEYKKFLESYSADDEKLTSTPETLLEEIEARNKELIGMKTDILNVNLFSQYRKTYDVQYFRLREEKREERRRRELERKRQREEERRKWKEEERRKRKEAEKLKKVDKCPEKERDKSKDEPKIKLLKKPEKDERDLEKKEKFKKLEKENVREEKAAGTLSSVSAKRSDGETKEEKGKKLVSIPVLSTIRIRLRADDRPAMQLYQPGVRSRSRLCPYEDIATKSADQGADKKQESETSNTKEEE